MATLDKRRLLRAALLGIVALAVLFSAPIIIGTISELLVGMFLPTEQPWSSYGTADRVSLLWTQGFLIIGVPFVLYAFMTIMYDLAGTNRFGGGKKTQK